MANKGNIKQILQGLAKDICALRDAPADENDRLTGLSGLPTIHHAKVMQPEFVEARLESLDKLEGVLGSDGAWSRSTIDDVLWDFVDHIAELQPDQRQYRVGRTVDEAVTRYTAAPSSWIVDRLVYGFDQSCAGVRFGQVLLLTEDVSVVTHGLPALPEFPAGIRVFARLETTAIDEQSAIQRAENTIDEHLMIIDALCAGEVPSLIQVSWTDHIRPIYSATRIARLGNSEAEVHTSGQHRRIPLTGSDLTAVVGGPLGSRLSSMLAAEDNEFNRRVLLGYQFAGAACVDHHPERSFIMLAIALESAILGKDTKSELTYQLGVRVAHLIGNGLNGRKQVARTVNELYDRRSRIVHTGQHGVSRKETALLLLYCTAALAMLAVAPSFRNFTTSAELEGWFRDRILDGPNHYTPGPSAETKGSNLEAS